jgi:hypothetical protein
MITTHDADAVRWRIPDQAVLRAIVPVLSIPPAGIVVVVVSRAIELSPIVGYIGL